MVLGGRRPGVRGPWLEGNYAPVMDELAVDSLEIKGRIPTRLNGSYLRNGPNPVFPPSPYHWFDGDGMIHSVALRNGDASYANRFVRTEGLREERAAGTSLYGGMLAGPPFKNAANTSIVHHANRTFAAWEGGSPYEIQTKSIETSGICDFEGQWPHAFTAHPKIDPATGEMLFFGYDSEPPYLRYGILDAAGRLAHAAEIDIPRAVMMHDFMITENYVLFFDLPLEFSSEGLKFHREHGARIGVVPRKGFSRDALWFEVEPCWVYHFLNAFEDGRQIVVHGCKRPGWPQGAAVLNEWRIDMANASVAEKAVDLAPSEYPAINSKFIGRRARYGYLDCGDDSGILRYDFERHAKKTFAYGPGRFGGEAIFAPDPTGRDEIDGCLLTFVYDSNFSSSELLIINAQELAVEASIAMPRRVPYGLHGSWIAGA